MGLRGEFGRVLAGGAGGLPEPAPAWSRPTPIGRAVPCIPPRPRPAGPAVGRGARSSGACPGRVAAGRLPAAIPPVEPADLAVPFTRVLLPPAVLPLPAHQQCLRGGAPLGRGGPLLPPSPTLHGSPTCPPGPRPAASGGIVPQPALLAGESYAASCRREAPDGARDRGRAFFRRPSARESSFKAGAAALLAGPRRAAPAAGVTPPRTRPSDIPCVGTRAVPPRPHRAARGWRRGGGRRFGPPRPAPRAGEAPARPVAAHGIPHGR